MFLGVTTHLEHSHGDMMIEPGLREDDSLNQTLQLVDKTHGSDDEFLADLQLHSDLAT